MDKHFLLPACYVMPAKGAADQYVGTTLDWFPLGHYGLRTSAANDPQYGAGEWSESPTGSPQ